LRITHHELLTQSIYQLNPHFPAQSRLIRALFTKEIRKKKNAPQSIVFHIHATNPMPLILFNKPYQVMCQFSPHPSRLTLASYLTIPNVYPAGRLDADSEGLVLLTDDGVLQHAISHPQRKQTKTYIVQLEGNADPQALNRLRQPLDLGDFITRECEVKQIQEPEWLWERDPPIRHRTQLPTSWIAITLQEGKNRQVRRMTAAVGLPTLRLVRISIGPFSLERYPLWPGQWTEVSPAMLNEPK
jgi:23S rRNA pseudouridine2457 synthase